MPTVVGARGDTGVVLVADRVDVRGDTVVHTNVRRVFDLSEALIGSSDPIGQVQSTRAIIENQLRDFRLESGRLPTRSAIEHITRRGCMATDTTCLLGARTSSGHAMLSRIDPSGAITRDTVFSCGSGSNLAIGQLDRIDPETELESLKTTLTSLMQSIAKRDTHTGTNVDIVQLNDESGEN